MMVDDFDPDFPGDHDDDGLDENGNPIFECARYRVGKAWYCPIAGTEECDWECPH